MDVSLAPVACAVVRLPPADAAELEATLEGLARSLLPTAAALASDATEARELLEDTLSRVYERLPQLRDRHALEAWARRILVRQFLDRRRWLRRRPTTRLEISVEAAPARSDELIDVRHAIGRLDQQDRALVVLRYWMGFTVAECAAQLRIPEGTCKSRLHRVLKRLRDALE